MLRRLDRSEMTAMLRRVQRIGIRIVDLLVTMSTNRPSIPNPTGNPIIEFRVTLSGEESSSLTRPSCCCCCCCCGCCPCGAAPGQAVYHHLLAASAVHSLLCSSFCLCFCYLPYTNRAKAPAKAIMIKLSTSPSLNSSHTPLRNA